MTTQVLILPFARPPKGLAANDRCHWSTRNRSTQLVRARVCAWGESTVEPSPRLQVELVWVVKDRRKRDEDNLWPMLKAVCDGLGSDRGTSARLVADDSPEFMVKLAPRIEYRPGVECPFFEVRVTRLGSDD